MKNLKWLLLVIGIVAFTQTFAQHGRYGRRYYERYERYPHRVYAYSYPRISSSVAIIARLPFGAVAVTVGGRPYYSYRGSYYSMVPGGYMMVEPPVGVIVPIVIPPARRDEAESQTQKNTTAVESTNNTEYEKFVLEGKTYYKKGNKYYKAKITDSGEIMYEEVGEVSK